MLANILRIPGRSQDADTVHAEFDRLAGLGARFILPVTCLIETGNFVAQSAEGDRHKLAEAFARMVRLALQDSPPWTIRDVKWDQSFLSEFLAGNATGAQLVEHFAAKTLGAGDLAILVERDRFREETAYTDVRIWSLDKRLTAHS